MEFIQFHPTCLYHPQERSFLITEALRGEGGKLLLPPDGTRFMPAHDERAELAPRDIVARAIDFEMKKHGLDCVLLDATHLGEAFLKEHFPTIHARCLQLGIDITRQPIPVVPAAHYTCGGVVTDLHGRTDLPGLYASARPPTPACTAPTGWPATRCSNAWCWAAPAPTHILRRAAAPRRRRRLGREPGRERRRAGRDLAQLGRAAPADVELRGHRAHHQAAGARAAPHRAAAGEIDDYYANFRVTRDLLELRNLVDCAELIVRSALMRHESRGLHYSRDFPQTLPVSFPTTSRS
jgi:L-aspartate oxidase